MIAPHKEPVPEHWKDALVLLLAHGSETTPSAARLVKDHASALASRSLFADVRAVFLRDTPHPREVIEQAPNRDIYIIPFMISEGYSIDILIPAALGLTGTLTERISETGRRRIHVCHSIGTHDHITGQIVTMINTIIMDNDLNPQQTSTLITAHGTGRHPDNNHRATWLADHIATSCDVRDSHAVFLEEPPRIPEWPSLVTQDNVIAVPYLMTTGSHATSDVPQELGLSPDTPGFQQSLQTGRTFGPCTIGERKLWYAPVVGNMESIPDVAIDRVRDWDRENND